jgi:L-asparaginase
MRLLLIHTGGTLMMRGGSDEPLAVPSSYVADLVSEVPVLAKIADVDSHILFQLDSSDMQPEHWIELAELIHESLPRYDGVVVVHGTDTMAYTASALAFLLPDLDRPVILTGSQRPLDRIRSDARQNLIDAFQLATMSIPEVGLAFSNRLFRGCRATKIDAWGLDAFESPMCAPLAQLGVDIELRPHILPPRPRAPVVCRLEPRVLAVRLFPGLDARLLLGALDSGVRGLVLKAFGAGNIPTSGRSLLPVIEKAMTLDVPVVMVSQCKRAYVDLTRYAGGRAALDAGAIGAGDMTDEAALTKLMVAIAAPAAESARRTSRVQAAKAAFARAAVGEMSDPHELHTKDELR